MYLLCVCTYRVHYWFIVWTIVESEILGGGGEGVWVVLKELLRSWQLSRKKREEAEWGEGGTLLAWPTTAASLQITMEIHISNWTHKFQNRTGLDAKANSELYKSNRVCSAEDSRVEPFISFFTRMFCL